MTETMSPVWWRRAGDLVADDLGLLLITLDHPDLREPIRIVSGTVSVTSRGAAFVAWPVLARLPSLGSQPKRGSITIQAVDPRIGRTLRGLDGAVSCTFEYVSHDDLDEVIYLHEGLRLRNFEGDDLSVTAEVVGTAPDGQSWPVTRATPARTPGLFVS